MMSVSRPCLLREPVAYLSYWMERRFLVAFLEADTSDRHEKGWLGHKKTQCLSVAQREREENHRVLLVLSWTISPGY